VNRLAAKLKLETVNENHRRSYKWREASVMHYALHLFLMLALDFIAAHETL
jgi:hypothetical protein